MRRFWRKVRSFWQKVSDAHGFFDLPADHPLGRGVLVVVADTGLTPDSYAYTRDRLVGHVYLKPSHTSLQSEERTLMSENEVVVDLHIGNDIFRAEKLEEVSAFSESAGEEVLRRRYRAFAVMTDEGDFVNLDSPEEKVIEEPLRTSARSSEGQFFCGVDDNPFEVADEAAVRGLESGIVYHGPAARVCYEACIDAEKFWGTTRIPFYLESGPGKRVYVGYAEGPGAGRAALWGTKITMDPNWQTEPPILSNLLAHEAGHNLGLGHCCAPPDLMTNPVGVNHFTTQGDRDRIVNSYTGRGGKLEDPEPELPTFEELVEGYRNNQETLGRTLEVIRDEAGHKVFVVSQGGVELIRTGFKDLR